jgi:hypothetical protein
MNSTYKNTFLKLMIFIGLMGSISTSLADEPKNSIPEMTKIKKYSTQATINGDFEASRRQWLASLRKGNRDVGLDEDNIDSDGGTDRTNFSREYLQKMVDKIKTENTQKN